MDPQPHNPLLGPSASLLSSATSPTDRLRTIVDNMVAATLLWAPVWNEADELTDFRHLYIIFLRRFSG